VVNCVRGAGSKFYLPRTSAGSDCRAFQMPTGVCEAKTSANLAARRILSGWHTGCHESPQPGLVPVRHVHSPEIAMTNTPGSTPDTTFPKSGSTSPSSASPATPSSGGSGSRPGSAAGAAAATADAAIDQAAAAERDVVRRVVQGAHEAVDRIADKAIPAVERLRGQYNDAADALRQKADQAADLKDEWTESLRTAVREHPLAAIGTALALGVILAKLTSNNDR